MGVDDYPEKEKTLNFNHIIPKIDNLKTPNDFGFHKKSFNIKFIENELKKLVNITIEKELLETAEKDLDSRLKKQNLLTIESLILIDKEKKEDMKVNKIYIIPKEDRITKNGDSYAGVSNVGADSAAYEQHSKSYTRFMNNYLYDASETNDTYGSGNDTYYSDFDRKTESARLFEQGDEIINYHERIEYVRASVMNAIMHAPVNHVKPDSRERYEFWKMASKFNQILSFLYYDSVMM